MLVDAGNIPIEIVEYLPLIEDPTLFTNLVRYPLFARVDQKIQIGAINTVSGGNHFINIALDDFRPVISSFTNESQAPTGLIVRTHVYVPQKAYAIIVEIESYDSSVLPWTAYPIANRKFGRISILQNDRVVGGEFINHDRTIVPARTSVALSVPTDVVSDSIGDSSLTNATGIDSVVGAFANGLSGKMYALWMYDVYRVEYAPSSFFLQTGSDCPTEFDDFIGGLGCPEALAFYEAMGRPALPEGNALRDKLVTCFES